MRLSFTGAPEVAAPRARVWAHLMDPTFVAASAPGVEQVHQIDPTRFTVVSGFGVGAVRLAFALEVEICEQQPPERASMRARGRAAGSDLDMTASFRLEERAAGRTVMHWTSDAHLSGGVASLGGRLVEVAARKFTEQFWLDFARRTAASTPAG